MGLFGKSKSDNDFDLEISSYTDAAESGSSFDNQAEQDDAFGSFASASGGGKQSSEDYGIQDAIELMRKLPNVNSDIVITVVRKTLESANIQVKEIIADAQKRETEIEDRSDQLIMEIEKFESKIAELNEEITQLNTEIEETTRVKDLLLNSIAQDEPEITDKSVSSSTDSKKASAVADSIGDVDDAAERNAEMSKDDDLDAVMEEIEAVDKLPIAEKV